MGLLYIASTTAAGTYVGQALNHLLRVRVPLQWA